MSAEIQTSLFILTAEIAVVTTLAALLAAGLAWMRGRARMKAAQALRDAAARLPGEGEIVQQERALLGEFARAYLTRDADVLASLPARLLTLRQSYESLPRQTEAAPEAPVDHALQAEVEALKVRAEQAEKSLQNVNQQLNEALATINTLVQEYGRGEAMTPTAEAQLQSLRSLVAEPMAVAQEAEGVSPSGPEASPAEQMPTAGGMEDEAANLDLSLPETQPEPAPGSETSSNDEPGPGAPAQDSRTDADLIHEAKALGTTEAEASPAEPASAAPEGAEETKDTALPIEFDLSAEEPGKGEPSTAPASAADPLDELDIDALLEAELQRQNKLLQGGDPAQEDLDLAKTDLPKSP